jgi:hypothetical protein
VRCRVKKEEQYLARESREEILQVVVKTGRKLNRKGSGGRERQRRRGKETGKLGADRRPNGDKEEEGEKVLFCKLVGISI